MKTIEEYFEDCRTSLLCLISSFCRKYSELLCFKSARPVELSDLIFHLPWRMIGQPTGDTLSNEQVDQ